MRFKVDENLHVEAAELLRRLGHDAPTVNDQGMQGGSDRSIAKICRKEERAILTLDLDFADVRVYPPGEYYGIVVLRLADQSRLSVVNVLLTFK